MPDKHDITILNIKLFIKEFMVLLDESRLNNRLRASNTGFNQWFSSSCYIHGICDNNNIFIDIITHADI